MILCCGEALIDMIPGQTSDGRTAFVPYNGGSVYNTAIALGRLGAKVGLFAGMSTDFMGDQLRDGIRESNVDLKYCRSKDFHTTLGFVKLVNGQAKYMFLDDASAGRNLVKKDIPKIPKTISALHFGAISLVPEPCGGTYEFLMKREAKSKVITLDPNIRPTLTKDKRKHMARLNRLFAMADIVKSSDEDVKWMTGKSDFKAFAKATLRKGAKIVAITKGGDGVEVYTKRYSFSLPATKVKVVDTVGAGDTFTAGMLSSLLNAKLLNKKSLSTISESDLKIAASFAARAASVTCSRAGANPPWAKEMA